MLIRNNQLEALSQSMIRAFVDRMVTMAKLRYPLKTLGVTDLELRAAIHSGVTRARQYGIDLTGDVERFIRLMFQLRTFNFEEDPLFMWTGEVLRDTSLTPEAKLDWVEARAAIQGLIGDKGE